MEEAMLELIEVVKAASPALWEAGRQAAHALVYQSLAWVAFWGGAAYLATRIKVGEVKLDGADFTRGAVIAKWVVVGFFAMIAMAGVDKFIEAAVAPEYAALVKLIELTQ